MPMMYVENLSFYFVLLKMVGKNATIFFKWNDTPGIEAKHWTFQYES